MSDGRVEFEITADNSDVSNKISDTTNKLKAAAGQWESSTQSASNSSSMFAGVLQGIGQALSGMIVSAVKRREGNRAVRQGMYRGRKQSGRNAERGRYRIRGKRESDQRVGEIRAERVRSDGNSGPPVYVHAGRDDEIIRSGAE